MLNFGSTFDSSKELIRKVLAGETDSAEEAGGDLLLIHGQSRGLSHVDIREQVPPMC